MYAAEERKINMEKKKAKKPAAKKTAPKAKQKEKGTLPWSYYHGSGKKDKDGFVIPE